MVLNVAGFEPPIFGMNFIDASANDNPHLNHWTNSVKFCNMNGKGYYRLEYNIWFDPSQTNAAQC
jgi:hypothetical protein